MGKMGEFAGCCLESESVGPLGQGGMERRAPSNASCLDEHFHHGQYCPFESPVAKASPKLPVGKKIRERSFSDTTNIYSLRVYHVLKILW